MESVGLPLTCTRGAEIGNPVETFVQPVEVTGYRSQNSARIRVLLGKPVEPAKLDMRVFPAVELGPHRVDEPFACLQPIVRIRKIERLAIDTPPVSGDLRIDVPIANRFRNRDHHPAFDGRGAEMRSGLSHRVLQGADARIVAETVVDQTLPCGPVGRAERPTVVGVAVGEFHPGASVTVGIHDLQQQEAVEEPLRPPVRIRIGDVVGQTLSVPFIRSPMVPAAIDQHQIRNGGYSPAGKFPIVGFGHEGIGRDRLQVRRRRGRRLFAAERTLQG